MNKSAYIEDTIAAIATAPGQGSVAIVRLSGPRAIDIAEQVFTCPSPALSGRPVGSFVHGYMVDADGRHLDEGIALISRAPHSFTTEDVIELQGHGGTVNAKRVLRRCLDCGARLAEPGEFTRRAFLNGRIDLMQAEAVADLVNAHSERASTAALEQLEGQLSHHFNSVYEELIRSAGDLEASLDFPEDELPETVISTITTSLLTTYANILKLVETWDEGQLLRDGALVVISGRPNVGKSTLLNTLLGNDRAIVSNQPGTTRDTVEEDFVLAGIPLRLIDTAGLRPTEDDIERVGIERTLAARKRADLHLYVVDASRPLPREDLFHLKDLSDEDCIVVLNKIDQGFHIDPGNLQNLPTVSTSLTDGTGLDLLKKLLEERLSQRINLAARPHAVISERHRDLLNRTAEQLNLGIGLLKPDQEDQWVLAVSHLRNALECLGEATGKVYHDALLDQIFSKFCIGK